METIITILGEFVFMVGVGIVALIVIGVIAACVIGGGSDGHLDE